MRKWIIFRAEKRQPGWQERKLSHTGGLTKILAEHFDSSDKAPPQPGYRLTEYIQVEQFVDPQYPSASTHYRIGDWEVTRVETYTPDIPMGEFDLIVVCYCQYSPIDTPLHPMPERQVSLDSFNGDKKAYARWLESQDNKQTTEV